GATFSRVLSAALAMGRLGGGLGVTQQELTIGGLVAFMTSLFMLIWPLDALGWILARGEEATTASIRLAEVLDSRPEVVDRPRARAVSRTPGPIGLDRVS